MIKICSPQLGMSSESSLGGEIYDYQTIKGFTKKGFKVLVYLPKNRSYDKSLSNFDVTFASIKHVVPPWIYSFLMLPYLFRTYKREKFDVLRIHSPRFLGLGGLIFHLFHSKVPILCSAVTVDSPKIYYPIEKAIFFVSKKIVVQSEYMKSLLIKKYELKEEKIAVAYGGMIDSVKKSNKSYSDLDKNIPVILFMGVLVKRKNPEFLLCIVSEVKKVIPNIKLIFIGIGPEREVLIDEVNNMGLKDNVVFINSAYGEEKVYWFSRMDLFVLPSFDEGFGLVTTEAMSFGKPVVTSDKAAFKEIIDSGQNGYTLSLEKPELWVSTILDLLQNKTKAQKIGNNGLLKVKKYFNWERTYKLNAQVIKEIAK